MSGGAVDRHAGLLATYALSGLVGAASAEDPSLSYRRHERARRTYRYGIQENGAIMLAWRHLFAARRWSTASIPR